MCVRFYYTKTRHLLQQKTIIFLRIFVDFDYLYGISNTLTLRWHEMYDNIPENKGAMIYEKMHFI